MGLKFEVIGVEKGPLELNYNWRNLALYALSVGANVSDELDYVYEKNQKIIPTYWASILGLEEFTDSYEYGQYIPETLHYGFDIIYHKKMLKNEGKIRYKLQLKEIYDRGDKRGSLAVVEAVAYDENGEKLFTLITKDIDMSSGGFGGEKPLQRSVLYPKREPDKIIKDFIGPNQAALYRIDNDTNILHIDPEFAKIGGFNRPIIMGMCTAGYACRALIKAYCWGRPEMITGFGVRFTNVLEPGTNICTQLWRCDDHNIVFKLLNEETGEAVLDYCYATIS